MNAANHFAAQWADILWRATWQGGLVIAAVAILCLSARRMPASVRAWLWWLAGTQLFLRLVVAIPIVVQVPAASTPVGLTQPTSVESNVSDNVLVANPASMPIALVQPSARPEWPLFIVAAWVLGGVVVIGAGTRRLLRTRSMVVNAKPSTDPVAIGALDIYWGVGPGLPRLMESDMAPCPLLVGWLNPTIILPALYSELNSEIEVRMAVAHEVTHVCRRHYLFGLGSYVTQLAFFYHPLSWLASREAALAREEVCDLEVLRLTGQSPSSYARLLLKSAQPGAPVAALGVALGYRDLRRRISMLRSPSQDRPAVNRRGWTTLVVLIALASLPWQIVAQTKHSPTVPVAPRKPHAKHATRHQNQVTTITYERVNGKIIRTTNRMVKTVVRMKDVPRGVVIAEHSATAPNTVRYYIGLSPSFAPSKPPAVRYYKGLISPPGSTTTLFGPTIFAPKAPVAGVLVPPPAPGQMLVTPDAPLAGAPDVPTPFGGGEKRLGFQIVQVDPKNKAAGYKIISPDGHVMYAPVAQGSSGKGPVKIAWSTGTNGHAVGASTTDEAHPMLPPSATVFGNSGISIAPDTGDVTPVPHGYLWAYPGGTNGIKLVDPTSTNRSMSTKISINFESENAQQAILKLLKLAGGDYMFRAEIPSRSVTCKLTNVTVEKALRSVLDSLDLHLRVADGTTFIEH